MGWNHLVLHVNVISFLRRLQEETASNMAFVQKRNSHLIHTILHWEVCMRLIYAFPHPSVKCGFYNFSSKRKRASSTLGGAGSKVSHTKTHKMWMFEIVNLTDCPPKSIRRGNSSFFFWEILVGFLKHSATKKSQICLLPRMPVWSECLGIWWLPIHKWSGGRDNWLSSPITSRVKGMNNDKKKVP